MGVYAAGNSYGIPEDLIYSFPIEIKVSPSNPPPARSLTSRRGRVTSLILFRNQESVRPLTSVVPHRTRPGKWWTGSPSTSSPAPRWTPQRPSWWRSETPPWTSCPSDYPALPATSSPPPHLRLAARGSEEETFPLINRPSRRHRPCVCLSV